MVVAVMVMVVEQQEKDKMQTGLGEGKIGRSRRSIRRRTPNSAKL
jgi:hypothetical protein